MHWNWTPAHALWMVILIGTVFRLIAAAMTGLGIGESYYLASAQTFALSYYDQPPLSLWIIGAWSKLVGAHSNFLLRLPFIAMFAGVTYLMAVLTERLSRNAWAGVWAAFFLNLSPVFTWSAGVWLQPDGPLIVLWLAAAIFAWDVSQAWIKGEKSSCLSDNNALKMGAILGLLFLCKYHALLFVLGCLIFVLMTIGIRSWLRSRFLWIGLAVAIAFFLPVLFWNAGREWASFAFQGTRGIGRTMHVDWLLKNIGGQMLWVGPWIWLPLIFLFYRAARRGSTDQAAWFCVCGSVLPIVLFTAVSLWAPVGNHFHWQAPGYLMLFPLLGCAAARGGENLFSLSNSRWKRYGVVCALLAVLSLGGIITHAATGWAWPVLQRVGIALSEESEDPTLELLDWKPLEEYLRSRGWWLRLTESAAAAQAGEIAFDARDENLPLVRLFLAAPRWHVAGKISRAVRARVPVVCLDEDPRNLAQSAPQALWRGADALIILPGKRYVEMLEVYRQLFQSVEWTGAVPLVRGGRIVDWLQVYEAQNFRRFAPWPKWAQSQRSGWRVMCKERK